MFPDTALANLEGPEVELERRLDEEGGLPISVVDGLLAGVLLCPEAVAEDEWLSKAAILIPQDPDGSYDETASPELIALIRRRYAAVEQEMRAGYYVPIFAVDDEEPDGVRWQPWINGFSMTFALRREAWSRMSRSRNADVATATMALMRLWAHGRSEIQLPVEDIDAELLAYAPDMINKCTDVLSVAKYGKKAQSMKEIKTGRNDPCPCGSGRKFKKCCGAA